MPSRRDAAPEECLYTLLDRASFDTKQPLHAEAFTVNTLPRRFFFKQKYSTFVRKGFFTHSYFYKQVFLHGYFYGEMLLHTGALN